MQNLSEYLTIIENRLKSIEYPGSPSGLYDPIAYTLDGGGKRLRPTLTLAACEAFGGNEGQRGAKALSATVERVGNRIIEPRRTAGIFN